MTDVLPGRDPAPSLAPLSFGDALWPAFNALRVPLAVAALAFVVLVVPEQGREIYRVLAQERVAAGAFQYRWLLAMGSLTLLSFVLWQVARLFANVAPLWPEARHNPITQQLLDWGPRLIAIVPLLGASLGVSLSRTVPPRERALAEASPALLSVYADLVRLADEFMIGSLVLLALALTVLVVATLFEKLVFRPKGINSQKLTVLNLWLMFPLAVLASIGYILSQPVQLPQYFGAMPIFALWMVNLAVVLALLSRYYSIAGIPMMVLLSAWALVIEFNGLADNHRIRHGAAPAEMRPDIEWVFDRWLENRADREMYRRAGKPYPVYIVAAEGGGLYAAYQSAKVLSRMQDLCPRFAQHVFTISGVSGGSLGAGMFAALAKDSAPNHPDAACAPEFKAPGALETRADQVLAGDFLSPVIWGALYPDFLQRFIPYPIGALDRARSLEYAFEAAWGKPGAGNTLSDDFMGLCGAQFEGCTKGATPLLALNTTHVESGVQVVLSPARFKEVGYPWTNTPTLYDFFLQGTPVTMPLSTAIGLSARFPWLSPGGWYEYDSTPDDGVAKLDGRATFADGAYVDNSGVATAQKLIRYLRARLATTGRQNDVEFKLISISSTYNPIDMMLLAGAASDRQSELLFPIQTALTAQWGRGFTLQSDAQVDSADAKVAQITFSYTFMPVPLGWQISALSRKYIELFAGRPQECNAADTAIVTTNLTKMLGSIVNRTNCVSADIVKELSPGTRAAQN